MEIKTLDRQTVLSLLPERDPWVHKGTFGKVLMLCGSRGYTGAAYLAAMGALRSGAGLVFLGVPESIYAIEAVKLNEAIVFPLPEEEGLLSEAAVPEILSRLNCQAVLIGCGLGQSAGTFAVVKAVLENFNGPVVLDADGINLIQKHTDVVRGRKYPTILTPHDGEAARICDQKQKVLLEESSIRDTASRMTLASGLAAELNSIILLKGHRTCITDGKVHYCNCTGNPGMAVGGSGDVLAGIIVSLLGQGMEPLEAAACGAWLHGAAGDLCARDLGLYGMLPTDMLTVLPRLMK